MWALRRGQEQDGGLAVKAQAIRPSSPWSQITRDAFLSMPFTIRALYAHAYIDRLWNLGATERATQLGLAGPVDGDLVHDALLGGARVYRRGAGVRGLATPGLPKIFDVLLPRPGTGVALPENGIGVLMKSYLAYDGLDPESLCLEASNGSRSHVLRGVHRPVVARPMGLRWGLRRSKSVPGLASADISHTLIVDFSLGPGQYATMAMREVMRKRPPRPPPRHVVFSDGSEPEAPSPARSTRSNRTVAGQEP